LAKINEFISKKLEASGAIMQKFGQICLEQKFITEPQLNEALRRQTENGLRIGKTLAELGHIDGEQLAQALAIQLQLDYCRPLEEEIAPEVLAILGHRLAEKHRVIPLRFEADRLWAATADPLNLTAIDWLREETGRRIKLLVASEEQISQAFVKHYGAALDSVVAVLEELDEAELSQYHSQHGGGEISAIAPETMANEAPIIRLVNTLIAGAVKLGASDIHLEPFEDEVKVRYRIDGVLQETHAPPQNLHAAMISRIKLMAGMDITEHRIPQDGRIRLRLDSRDLDLRVAVVPTIHGEEAVLRILNRESILLGLEQLGLSPENTALFTKAIAKPHGMILVTGPTGSGKTTTLYAALQKLNLTSRKIITIEDPVEYQLKGVNQVQVNPKLNFSFAQGLRTLVRHDPDIILVGEIRDRETAEVAVQSALTGHLVFATLHTNDAPTAFTRLIDMGIEEFLVASTVHAVLAQRLVRRVCLHCRQSYKPTPQEAELLGMAPKSKQQLMVGTGCPECNQIGYRGQIGIFEMLLAEESIERLIMERSNATRIRQAAISEGMITLRQDGIAKVKAGITTLAEVLRVTRD
jgi:type II secretion system protein E